MKPLLAIPLLLFAGCLPPAAPKSDAPKSIDTNKQVLDAIKDLASSIRSQPKPESVSKDDLQRIVHDTLHEHLDEMKEAKPEADAQFAEIVPQKAPPAEEHAEAPKRTSSTPSKFIATDADEGADFTGIVMVVRGKEAEKRDGPCVPCRRGEKAAHAMEKFGWLVSDKPNGHVWLKETTLDDEGKTPRFELFVVGKHIRDIDGFDGSSDESALASMSKILWQHPVAVPESESPIYQKRKGTIRSRASAAVKTTSADCSGLSAPDCSGFSVPDCATPKAVSDCSSPITSNVLTEFSLPVMAQASPIARPQAYYVPKRSSIPSSALVRHGGTWGWPGRPSIAALKNHLKSAPHGYTESQLRGLSASQLSALHSNEHSLHVQRGGNPGAYFPGMSDRFRGNIAGAKAYRAPRPRYYGASINGTPMLGQQGNRTYIGGMSFDTVTGLVSAGATAALLAL